MFFWFNILDKKDWEDIRDEQLNRLTDYLKLRMHKNNLKARFINLFFLYK